MDKNLCERVENSFENLHGRGEELVEGFYVRLFLARPDLRVLFPQDMRGQRAKLFQALAVMVAGLRDLDRLAPVLRELGTRHVSYGVKDRDYGSVSEALIRTLEELLGGRWTPELERDWRAALMTTSQLMNVGS